MFLKLTREISRPVVIGKGFSVGPRMNASIANRLGYRTEIQDDTVLMWGTAAFTDADDFALAPDWCEDAAASIETLESIGINGMLIRQRDKNRQGWSCVFEYACQLYETIPFAVEDHAACAALDYALSFCCSHGKSLVT
jgi:hypothetical protein